MSDSIVTESRIETTRIDSQKSKITLAYSIVGTMLPFFISFVVVVFFSFYSDILKIIDRGDLFIYSAGIYTSAIITFMNNKKELRIQDRNLYHLSYLLVFIASIAFAVFLFRDSIQGIYNIVIQTNYYIIRVMSILLISFSIYVLKTAIDYACLNTPPETRIIADAQARKNVIMEEL
jgi:hypothetical protein